MIPSISREALPILIWLAITDLGCSGENRKSLRCIYSNYTIYSIVPRKEYFRSGFLKENTIARLKGRKGKKTMVSCAFLTTSPAFAGS